MLFVVDISGSMKGRTIEATKSAVVAAMSKLDQGDSFNVMAFNDQTYLYSSTLELATKEALQKATDWIGMNFIAGGGTNMSAALNQVISFFQLQSVRCSMTSRQQMSMDTSGSKIFVVL